MRPHLAITLALVLAGCTTRPFNPDDVGEGEGDGGEGEGEGEGECPDLAPACRSVSDDLCIAFQECSEVSNPVQECIDAKASQSVDDKACSAACKSEGDAYAECYSANSACQDQVLTLDPSDACDDQLGPLSDCSRDNC